MLSDNKINTKIILMNGNLVFPNIWIHNMCVRGHSLVEFVAFLKYQVLPQGHRNDTYFIVYETIAMLSLILFEHINYVTRSVKSHLKM